MFILKVLFAPLSLILPLFTQSKSPDAKQHQSFYGSRLFSSNSGEAKKLLRSISNP